MYKTKLNKIQNIIEKIKNDITLPIISNFLEWFFEKLDISFNKQNIYKWKISQYSIFIAHLWQNIWSEISKKRPVLILSSTWYSSVWNDILITWITDLYDDYWNKKKIYAFDIVISNYKKYWLKKESIIRLSSIKQIDKKRLIYRMWKLDRKFEKDIKEKFLNLFKFK